MKYPILFIDENFYNFLDAVLLFGSSIYEERLIIKRSTDNVNQALWASMFVEMHGIKLYLSHKDNNIVYSSERLPFIKPTIDRWYRKDGFGHDLTIPSDIRISMKMFFVWLLGSRKDIPKDLIKLRTPTKDSALIGKLVGWIRENTGLECFYDNYIILKDIGKIQDYCNTYIPLEYV